MLKRFVTKVNRPTTILLDRSSFEALSAIEIEKISQKYSIVCPWIFLAECLNPKKTDKLKIRPKIERLKFVMTPGELIHSKKQIKPLSLLEIIEKSLMKKELPFSFIEVVPHKLVRHYNFTNIRDLLDRYAKSFEDLELSGILHNFGILTKHSSLDALANTLNSLFSNQLVGSVTDPLYHLFNVDISSYPIEEKSPHNITLILYYSYLLAILHIGYSCKCEGFDQSMPSDFHYLFFVPFCDVFVSNDKNLLKIINCFQHIEGLDALYFRDIKPSIRDFQSFRETVKSNFNDRL